MTGQLSPEGIRSGAPELVLGVDTCGPEGSVALGRLEAEAVRILTQKELAGRSYSATLVAAVRELLVGNGVKLRDLLAIVVVSGPGSFTGVRVGLSAVKGLAEPNQIPVITVSRLEVLANKSAVASAALDAHRHEAYLHLEMEGGDASELLAGAEELAAIGSRPARVAVCDDGAAAMVHKAWPDVELVHTEAPDASDAMRLALPRILAGRFDDVSLIDGHYLRRSDAEIFGEQGAASAQPKKGQSK